MKRHLYVYFINKKLQYLFLIIIIIFRFFKFFLDYILLMKENTTNYLLLTFNQTKCNFDVLLDMIYMKIYQIIVVRHKKIYLLSPDNSFLFHHCLLKNNHI